MTSILLLDDEHQTTRYMEMCIRNSDPHLKVKTAHSRQEANEILSMYGPFDLIISDIQMIGDTGPEIIKGYEAITKPSKIVILSCMDDCHKEASILASEGFDVAGCLQKPIFPAELRSMLQRVLND